MYQLLIVDDEESIRTGLAECYPWENMGFSAPVTFADGKKALEYLIDNPVHAILSDIRMPLMDGLELAQRAAQHKPGVQVVLLSGYADFSYAQSAILSGVKAYLLKPVEYDALVDTFTGIKENLDRIHGVLPDLQETPGYYDRIIEKAKEYLLAHLASATLEATADEVGLSPNYLSKIIKKKVGSTFSECLLEARMKHALSLLSDPAVRIYEIAESIGYDNPKNFTRAFKSYFGKTPREFRGQEAEE